MYMAEGVNTRLKVPRSAKRGAVVSIKTQITHIMENGHRRDGQGTLIPRSIINRFVCQFEGMDVLDIAMGTSIATNPYFQFDAKVPQDAPRQGSFTFTWYDDDGSIYRDAAQILIV